jgi:hypothetical protein
MSLADAPPFDASQAANAVVLPAPSHCTVASFAAVVIVGGKLSMMVNVAVVGVLLPQESVAVKVTVALPVAPQPLLRPL